MNIINFKLNEIKPYENEIRNYNADHINKIVDSINEFDFTNPILIDENNVILAGHARYYAAQHIGFETIPSIIISHLNNSQKKAYRIADNKLCEKGQWNKNLLELEIKSFDIPNLEFPIELTGFSTTEIDLIINDEIQKEDNIEDFIDQNNIISKPGDIWQLGNHKLLCGDSLDIKNYKLLFNNEKANMIFTDPPYNVKISGHVQTNSGKINHKEFAFASGEMNADEFTSFLDIVMKNMISFSNPGALHYICMDWRHINEIMTAGNINYDEFKNLCIWNKDNGGMGSLYRSKHELIFIFKPDKNSKHINNVELGKNGRYRTNVWDYAGVNSFKNNDDLKMHPTVKPYELIYDAILDVTKMNDIVLDPFIGSGSTIIASENSNRRCYGIEYEPMYVDTAIKRWKNLTGEKAINLYTNEYFQAEGKKS